jgi:hypothetical protein
MHPSHLTAFVNGFLDLGITMQAKGATTWDILIAMSETGRADKGAVGADAILCRVRAWRDQARAGRSVPDGSLDISAMVSEMIAAASTGIAPAWA